MNRFQLIIAAMLFLLNAPGIFSHAAESKSVSDKVNQPSIEKRRISRDDVWKVAPALEKNTQQLLYGDVWKRPGLSARDRSIVTISALIARNSSPSLNYYFGQALDNGVKPAEISEIITHLAYYSGWGNAFAAVGPARDVFAERGIGTNEIPPPSIELLPVDQASEDNRAAQVKEQFGSTAPGLVDYTTHALFRDLWLRPGLAARDRSLVTVSALIASGQVAQIPYHLNRAMDSGLTQAEAAEVITHLAFYAGWPNAFSALPLAKEVFSKRAQAGAPSEKRTSEKKPQARAPAPRPFGAEAFDKTSDTTIRWLGNAGFFINSRGTTLMLDPLLKGFDMPLLFEPPISPKDVPRLDAVLVTHADNDHFSIPTIRDMSAVTRSFHSTKYVASLMQKEGWNGAGHNVGDAFAIEGVRMKLTPADHAWQNFDPKERAKREFKNEDACGFWIETADGTIWAPGDSRLMPEHLRMRQPDAILFDFSDNEWHFGLEGATKLANAYPKTPLLLCHWGTVDAPDFSPFNGDPDTLKSRVVNPDRIKVLAPGEPYRLERLK